jgi:hypothetical protein
MSLIDKPGVYELSMESYQRDPCPEPSLSSGIAHRLVTQSPLHAWHAHPRLNPSYEFEEATAFDLGSCSHALLLEGEESIQVIEADDWRTKAAKEARAKARFEGKIPVLAAKMEACRAMASIARKALADCQDGAIDLGKGKAERVLAWREAGIWCRARPDWMGDGRSMLLDYKSTAGSAEPNAWIRNQMGPMGYDLQAVHYLRGNGETGGERLAEFVFLVQENYPPYACSFVGIAPAMLEIAQRKRDLAVAIWQACIKRNQWHGYPPQIAYAEPSTWQLADDEDRRLTFDEKLDCATV